MEDWLTIKEAAALLRLSEHTVRDQVHDGKIPSTKLGHRTVRVRRVDIEKLLPPASPPGSPKPTGQGAVNGLSGRKLDRAGVGRLLLDVIEEEGGDPVERLSRIRAFAYGLIAE